MTTEINIQKNAEYASVIIKLLQGVIYEEDRKTWIQLMTYQVPVRQYFRTIGITLILDEREGFAYLSQDDTSYDQENQLPRLVRRIPLSYEVTILLVLLREILDEFDVQDTDSRKCYVTHSSLKDKFQIYFKEQSNQSRLLNKLDQYIKSVEELGFLKQLDSENQAENAEIKYEIKRIIKAKISVEKLEEIKENLFKNNIV